MNIADYIPHGLVVAFGGVVTYVFKDHVQQDKDRFAEIKEDLETIKARQQVHNDTMNTQHAEVLKLLIDAGQHREMQAAITEHAINRDRPPGRSQS